MEKLTQPTSALSVKWQVTTTTDCPAQHTYLTFDSDAVIVSGGEPYLADEKRQLTTTDNEIHERAFFNCRSIRNLILPKTITAIGDGAFGKVLRLEEAEMVFQQVMTRTMSLMVMP